LAAVDKAIADTKAGRGVKDTNDAEILQALRKRKVVLLKEQSKISESARKFKKLEAKEPKVVPQRKPTPKIRQPSRPIQKNRVGISDFTISPTGKIRVPTNIFQRVRGGFGGFSRGGIG
jgi:hypothetical protein